MSDTVIGLKPNQVPRNAYLGALAYMNKDEVVEPGALMRYWAITDLTKVSQLANDAGYLTTVTGDTRYAKPADISSAVAELVNQSPETLDTLNELAAALGNDPNFATTVANRIGTKADKTYADGIKTTADAAIPKAGGNKLGPLWFHNGVIQAIDGTNGILISGGNAFASETRWWADGRVTQKGTSLTFNGNDLGRWAAIAPTSKADASALTGYWSKSALDPNQFFPKTGGDIAGPVTVDGEDLGIWAQVDPINAVRRHNSIGNSWANSQIPAEMAYLPNGSSMAATARPAAYANLGIENSFGVRGGFHVVDNTGTVNSGFHTSAFSSWRHILGDSYAGFSIGWGADGMVIAVGSGGNVVDARFGFDGIFRAPKFQPTSDLRKKTGLKIIDGARDKLDSLLGYTYYLNGQKERSAGLIAQDVRRVLPEAVSADSAGILSLDYAAVTALLVNAVNELKEEVQQLKEQINA